MGLADTFYNVRASQGARSRSKYCGLAPCCLSGGSQPRIVVHDGTGRLGASLSSPRRGARPPTPRRRGSAAVARAHTAAGCCSALTAPHAHLLLQVFVKRNSVYVATIIVGAFVGERVRWLRAGPGAGAAQEGRSQPHHFVCNKQNDALLANS